MRTRLFLRTAEFLWQEGHTAHATSDEAMAETRTILDLYANFCENYIAMPVIKGEKTAGERFPGAVTTYTIEAMMQDRKALQAGTSHFLGQNFSKAQEIKFQDDKGGEQFAWTTSWGVTTRLVGALVMTHSDDDGLVLPPRLAPKHIAISPIFRSDEERAKVIPYCQSLEKQLAEETFDGGKVQVWLDMRDIGGGDKKWDQIKRGVPVRIEVGPRDMEKDTIFGARRDTGEKLPKDLARTEFVATIGKLLGDIQSNLLVRAKQMRSDNTRNIENLNDFKSYFTPDNTNQPEIHGGFALCHFSEGPEVNAILKDLKVTIRCIPIEVSAEPGKCIFTGKPSARRAVFAKAY
jgi:prolyl-tRNA synthetase